MQVKKLVSENLLLCCDQSCKTLLVYMNHSVVLVYVTLSSQLVLTNPFFTTKWVYGFFYSIFCLTLPQTNTLGGKYLLFKGSDDSALECRREVEK